MKPQKRSAQLNPDFSEGFDAPAGSTSKPTHEEISVVAHQIYEEAGCPSGCADAHWQRAEHSLHKGFFDR